ncbi:EF-hand domain-containing protein [Desulfovibrio psychrotolerans]|uniref:EF-hand domain-containing protein n=1 Tax=Desulfovibrio psychrotolerans TaxID=415242 RepID=A0A7J0BUD8_9BACT|nr:EF-hand domain-containing protein [Desulfovibrio psychrotolerans]GFM36614.1 hypothetical protein DSM19430T_12980 [Desulfovibrio psychrotolerans]
MSVSGIDVSQGFTGTWQSGLSRGLSRETDYGEMARNLLADRDENGDGALSASELGMSRRRFADLDTNGDGVVSPEELAAHLEKSGKGDNPALRRMAAAIIQEQDADGDGKISRAESSFSDEEFDACDKDGDGFLTEDELVQAMGGGDGGLEAAMRNAADGDSPPEGDDRKGTYPLGEEERKKASGPSVTQDLNGDGVVSAEEMQAVLEHGLAKARSMAASGELRFERVGLADVSSAPAAPDSPDGVGGPGESNGPGNTAGTGVAGAVSTGSRNGAKGTTGHRGRNAGSSPGTDTAYITQEMADAGERTQGAAATRPAPPWLLRRAMDAYSDRIADAAGASGTEAGMDAAGRPYRERGMPMTGTVFAGLG